LFRAGGGACWWHYLLAGPEDSGWLSSARPGPAGSLGHITSQPGSLGTSKECERDVHQHRQQRCMTWWSWSLSWAPCFPRMPEWPSRSQATRPAASG